jgi:hypothetical protein
MYFTTMIASLLFAILFAYGQENISVFINNTGERYKEHNGIVRNNYIITVHNTQKSSYTYAVKSQDPNYTVGKFSLSLSPDKIRKRVLVVSTDSKSYSSSQKDTVVKLDLIIYAKEDPKISVKREISFMYPRAQ